MKPGKIQHSWALGLSSLILLGCSSAWAESPKGASLFQRLGVSLPSTLVTLPASVQAQLKNFGFQVNPLNSVKSHGITTQRYQINRNGIEVLGAVAMTHQGPMATDGLLEGNEIPLFDISTEPKLKADQASRIALGIIGNRDLQAEPQLKILPSEKDDGSAQLIYWVSISPTEDQSGRDILLDANQGQLVADLSRDIEIAPTEVLMASDKCQSLDVVSGAPVQLNPENCTLGVRSGIVTPDADETAIRADTNSQAVLKYYWTTHGRDSFDDRGSKLTSIVHVGRAFANAFWSSDRNIMAYGDGDGVVMTDLTKALDVAGHEMTHGVTSQTSQLIYRSESGALNEAFSDFFGVVIAARERNSDPDWAVGKEIFANERKLIGLRSLKDPGSIMARIRDDEGKVVVKPYPAHVKDQFQTQNPCGPHNDRCFVHTNSMIPGHAMYLISEAIGMDDAERLLYLTLTQYLTKTSTFKAFRTQTMKACRQLYSRSECTKVRKAFAEVGL